MPVEVKVELEELKKGMYVSRLDRPWIETSFLMEGLLIGSDGDIEILKKSCAYVYIDADRGESSHLDFIKKKISDKDNSQQSVHSQYDSEESLSRNQHKPVEDKPEKLAQKGGVKSVESSGNHDLPSNKKNHGLTGSHENHSLFSKKRNRDLSSYNGYLENIDSRRKRSYKDKTEFSVELKTASVVHKNLGNNFQQILSDLGNKKNLDIKFVEEGVTDMTNSIIRNPSAMTWVAHIKRLDDYSYSRALGTSVWCATFGRHLGLENAAIESLALGGLLLDIGKSILPAEFLTLSRKLTPMEFRVMKKHVQFSHTIISEGDWSKVNTNKLNDICAMVAQHHERADASGYPLALENKEISFFGRMAGIVDSFDAMTSERAYMGMSSRSANNAINELYSLRDTKFQPELVEQFIQTVGVYPTGSLVELNTGEVGVVVSVNSLRRLRPTIMLILGEEKQPLKELREIDLDKLDNGVSIANGLPSNAFDINLSELFL